MAQNEKPAHKTIQIKASDEVLRGRYANFMRVNFTPEEFIFDFCAVQPADGTAMLTDRVFMNPGHAKRMIAVLQHVMKQYEQAHGSVAASEQPHEIGFKTE